MFCSAGQRVSTSSPHATTGETQYPVANPVGAVTHLVIAHDVEQRDDVGAARQILQDLDFALYLLLLDGLEDLDDAFLVVDDVDALEDLGVFAAADLADDLVVFEDAPGDVDRVVVPVGAGHVGIDIGVDTREARGAARVVKRHGGSGRGLGTREQCQRREGAEEGRGVECEWGSEVEAGGSKQQGKASEHAEGSCLVAGDAPKEAVTVVAAGARRALDGRSGSCAGASVCLRAAGLWVLDLVRAARALRRCETAELVTLTHDFLCPACAPPSPAPRPFAVPATMFHDLNVPWTDAPRELQRTVAFLDECEHLCARECSVECAD